MQPILIFLSPPTQGRAQVFTTRPLMPGRVEKLCDFGERKTETLALTDDL
jgi:hypothetical protein